MTLKLVVTEPETQSQIHTVPFDGDDLQAVQQDGKVWVVLKRACEALGLDHSSQAAKLKDKAWACMVVITTHDSTGRNQDLSCLDLDSLPMWLATIDVGRVADGAKEKLIRYQRECAKVLRDHFMGTKPAFQIPATYAAALAEAARLAEIAEENARKALQAEAKAQILEEEKLELSTELAETLDEMGPKAEVYDNFMASKGDISVEEFAKLCGTTSPKMWLWLRDRRWVFKGQTLPTAEAVRRGYMYSLAKTRTKPDGTVVPYVQTRITPKGVEVLGMQWRDEEAALLELALQDVDPTAV